jgi:hypothetical protein
MNLNEFIDPFWCFDRPSPINDTEIAPIKIYVYLQNNLRIKQIKGQKEIKFRRN